MKRTHLIAFVSMFVLLALLGCDQGTAESAAHRDQVDQSETSAMAPPPVDPVSEPATAPPRPVSPDASARTGESPNAPLAPSAYVVIQNAPHTDPQLLVRQLQQVLPQTQVVKQVQSPDPREMKLEVTNTVDVLALANKIPFASVESVDVATRTITVDFDL